jgi:hypothetical protein
MHLAALLLLLLLLAAAATHRNTSALRRVASSGCFLVGEAAPRMVATAVQAEAHLEWCGGVGGYAVFIDDVQQGCWAVAL